MYWTFLVSIVCTFILSYPPTSYIVEGIRGPVEFSTRMGLVGFVATAFVLGFFMSLGKAAVYKHIPSITRTAWVRSVALSASSAGWVGSCSRSPSAR